VLINIVVIVGGVEMWINGIGQGSGLESALKMAFLKNGMSKGFF
jgi:hypothetical protein